MAVKAIPAGYHSVTPYLIVDDATRALEFYKNAFGAVEKFRMAAPDGKIHHAEMTIGDSTINGSPPVNAATTCAPRSVSEVNRKYFVTGVVSRPAFDGTICRPVFRSMKLPVP